MNTFLSRFAGSIHGVLSGFDRIRFRGTQRLLASVRGMAAYLSFRGVLLRDFKSYVTGGHGGDCFGGEGASGAGGGGDRVRERCVGVEGGVGAGVDVASGSRRGVAGGFECGRAVPDVLCAKEWVERLIRVAEPAGEVSAL